MFYSGRGQERTTWQQRYAMYVYLVPWPSQNFHFGLSNIETTTPIINPSFGPSVFKEE